MKKNIYPFEKMELGYNLNEMTPYIEKEIMDLHYNKHYNGYIVALNAIVEKLSKAQSMTATELIENVESFPKNSQKDILFNAGGIVNHELFLSNIAPPNGKVSENAEVMKLRDEFSACAKKLQGSGWVAIVSYATELRVISFANHETLPCDCGKVVLMIDVWEHAYYLQYKNDRAKFVDEFFSIINWEEVNKRIDAKNCNCCKS